MPSIDRSMMFTFWCVVEEASDGFYIQPQTLPHLPLEKAGPFVTQAEAKRIADAMVQRVQELTANRQSQPIYEQVVGEGDEISYRIKKFV